MVLSSRWLVEHFRKGKKIAERIEENLVPNEFINYALDAVLSGGTAIATWYVALFSNNFTPVSVNTYATPGYTEATSYTESDRQVWSEAGVSAKSITNSAAKASFTMNGNDTSIYGASLVTVATKGDAAGGGVLGPVAQFSGGAITGIVNTDVIKVTITVNGSDV
jgi:hypothetical protein